MFGTCVLFSYRRTTSLRNSTDCAFTPLKLKELVFSVENKISLQLVIPLSFRNDARAEKESSSYRPVVLSFSRCMTE